MMTWAVIGYRGMLLLWDGKKWKEVGRAGCAEQLHLSSVECFFAMLAATEI